MASALYKFHQSIGDKLYLYQDETRDIQSNITLCLMEFSRAKPKGNTEGKGLYVTAYPELSLNTDIISFLKYNAQLSVGKNKC